MLKLNLNQLKQKNFLPRDKNAHKGQFGHVLIVGGAVGMGGSVRMSAEAALRVGAGLVSVATHPDHAAFITMQRPEIMSYGIKMPEQLSFLLEKATVIVIGMGLGQSNWGKQLFSEVLKIEKKPLVLDADALNLLALLQPALKKFNWILTPHPGEAARLLDTTTELVQNDRSNAVKALQSLRQGVCVLKGRGTLVKDAYNELSICTAGNPGMATAGMGDVLSGVIGGLLAQGLSFLTAAELGVCLHAEAADTAAKENGECGLLAMDLMPYLQKLLSY